MARNRWSASVGTGGRHASESVVGIRRNGWSACLGIRITVVLLATRGTSNLDRHAHVNLVRDLGIEIHVNVRCPDADHQGIPHRSIVVL